MRPKRSHTGGNGQGEPIAAELHGPSDEGLYTDVYGFECPGACGAANGDDRDCRLDRVSGDLSLDVHDGERAHARDWSAEIARRFEALRARIILSETALLCVGGFVVGIGLSFLVRVLIRLLFPSLPQALITLEWCVYACLIAVAGGLLGALYPTWMASRKDPVEALAYE